MRYHELLENENMVRSDGFRKWFDDSKIVDAAGQPLKLYRGLQGDYIQVADRMEPRAGYSMFFSTSPHVAATYANSDFRDKFAEPGAIYPVYVKAHLLREFPTKKGSFDKFEFDRVASRLTAGTGLVARAVRDIGPRGSRETDPEGRYSYASDIYAFGRGTSIKSAVSNTGKFDPDNPAMTETYS